MAYTLPSFSTIHYKLCINKLIKGDDSAVFNVIYNVGLLIYGKNFSVVYGLASIFQ